MLTDIPTILVHRPDVHGAITVCNEIDATVPPHWRVAFSVVVAGQFDRFCRTVFELPDVTRRTTYISFGNVVVEHRAGEIECRPITVIGAFTGRKEGDERPRAVLQIELH